MLDDYDIYRRDRPSRGGGVLIAIKNPFDQNKSPQPRTLKQYFAKFDLKVKKPPNYWMSLQTS